jgi:hypothetical protein
MDKKMKIKSLALFWWLSIAMIGCTARGAYEGWRQDARRDCNVEPEPERTACLESLRDDYDTYKKKRDGTY